MVCMLPISKLLPGVDATVETRVGRLTPSAIGTERYNAICSRKPVVFTLAMLLESAA
ncbi:hypothetical protein D3C81_2329310 [compost metagenome]